MSVEPEVVYKTTASPRAAPLSPDRPRRGLGLRPIADDETSRAPNPPSGRPEGYPPSATTGISEQTLSGAATTRDILESFGVVVGMHLDGDDLLREMIGDLRRRLALVELDSRALRAANDALKREVTLLGQCLDHDRSLRAPKAAAGSAKAAKPKPNGARASDGQQLPGFVTK
jgi:hypothetical protein